MEQIIKYNVKTYKNGNIFDNIEDIVEEKHYQLNINGEKFVDIICSPFNLEEMAVGYLWMNGVIDKKEDIVTIDLDCSIDIKVKKPRIGHNIELKKIISETKLFKTEVCEKIAMLEREAQLFQKTGGVHCAAIIDVEDNKLIVYMEDIGRHNTLDKIAGYCLLNNIDMKDKIIAFSGRLPYEIVFKTIKMEIPIIVSISAPTSLGIDYAKKYGVTLCGFTRKDKYHIYANDFRIINEIKK